MHACEYALQTSSSSFNIYSTSIFCYSVNGNWTESTESVMCCVHFLTWYISLNKLFEFLRSRFLDSSMILSWSNMTEVLHENCLGVEKWIFRPLSWQGIAATRVHITNKSTEFIVKNRSMARPREQCSKTLMRWSEEGLQSDCPVPMQAMTLAWKRGMRIH